MNDIIKSSPHSIIRAFDQNNIMLSAKLVLSSDAFFKVICEGIPKSKRFSNLSQLEFIDLWKHLTTFVENTLKSQKSVNVPGIGSFLFIKKSKSDSTLKSISLPHFIPSKSWEKIPGYVGINQIPINGISHAPIDQLNYSAISQLSGFRRDDVETALKDIVHGFFKVLKRGGSIILPFGNLGKLILKQKEVRIKFYPEFIVSALSEISQSQEQESNDKDEVSTSRPQTNQEKYENSTQNQPSQAQPQKSTTNSFPNSEQPSKPDKKADQNEKDQDPQFFLGFSMGVHTHPHSGDRLWTDAKCPVCRQSKMPVIELKEQIAKKDKENDRLLLNASLSNDSEYLRRTKEFELSKLKTAIATAQYNHTKAMEREFERKREIRNLPMGDLYENRAPPPNRVLQNKLLSEGIKEQIATKAKQKNEERVQKEINDRNFNKMFIQEMEQSKIQAHLEKLSKQAQLRESLLNPPSAVHPQSHTVLAETSPAQTLNSFARSESLMFLYKREKAKQLYREQLAIVEQKKLWEKKCLEIERMGELERLANSRKELEKDMKTIKQANFEARSSLEAYWSQQVALKKKLFAESAMNE